MAGTLNARARLTLEQLLLPRPAQKGMEFWHEQVRYTAARLAKLGVSMQQVSAAYTRFRPLAEARLRSRFGAGRAAAAQAWFQRQTETAVAEACVALQGKAVEALVKVLDAELGAANLEDLLQRLLGHAAQLFPIRWGEILLLDEDAGNGAPHAAGPESHQPDRGEIAGTGPRTGVPDALARRGGRNSKGRTAAGVPRSGRGEAQAMLAAPAQPQPRAVRRREAGRLSCAPSIQPAHSAFRARPQAGPDAPAPVVEPAVCNSGGAYRDVRDDGRPTEPALAHSKPGRDDDAARRASPRPARSLRHAAAYGLTPGMILETAGVGPFFRRVLRRGSPAFLLDAANDPRVAQPYYRALEVKSVWAVPLVARQLGDVSSASGRPLPGIEARKPSDQRERPGRRPVRPEVLGILTVGFDRVYECLPQERDLLLALAERSTLAIERTRMAERLRREQARVVDLSRRLLAAHEEERRRIGRDLHDETGQALLALRLYLEMGLRQSSPEAARAWLDKAVALVDRSVAELRRILAQLSPLLLDELGLEPALRLELRRLRAQHGWRARFRFVAGARLDHGLEVLVYRLVLEGLRNAARHARARRVHLTITCGAAEVAIRLRDDGVGLPRNQVPPPRPDGGRFGLSGMRERVRLAGGQLELRSPRDGRGLCLAISLPLHPAARAAYAS